MCYIDSRFYDFAIGRFICSDIVENIAVTQNILEINLYSYCECDPINNYDINGAISWKKILSVLNKIADGLLKLISWGVSKGIKFFSKFIPVLGGVAGFLLGEVIGRALDILFERNCTRIANKYSNAVDVYRFSLGDYFITFFACLK